MFSFTNPIDQEVWGLVLYIFEPSGCNEVKMSLVVKGHENVVDFRPGFFSVSSHLNSPSSCFDVSGAFSTWMRWSASMWPNF